MKIGILGAGAIGTTLAQRLGRAGHDVAIANSRGPETIQPSALKTGARAVWATEVTDHADVVIVSVTLSRIPDVAPLVRNAPAEAIIIDTSNYFPHRDGHFAELDEGQVESLWVAGHYGRPIAKAWNSVTSQSFANRATEPGAADRIAIPVAADEDSIRKTAITLVEATGFDAFDAGSLVDSWRQQPGTPAYCTDLTMAELPEALAAANAARSPLRRDLVLAVIAERVEVGGPISGDYLLNLHRAIH